MTLVWVCMAFASIAIILIFCLAYEHDRGNLFQKKFECEVELREKTQRELNRLKIAMQTDRELHEIDFESMRREIKSFEQNVDKLENALRAKNAEIVRLKKEAKNANVPL